MTNFQPQIDPQAPPAIKTLIYAPQARIYIIHNNVQYDVSADLVRGQVIRKENSASSLAFTLANKPLVPGGQPRYNAGEAFAFSRMDVVTLWLKRTEWVQIFTGFLDTIPYKQIYPGTVDFRATCTLKKLMHTWWNPALPQNASLLDQFSFGQSVGGDGQLPVDSGLGGMLRNLVVKVGQWNESAVQIQNFPIAMMPFVDEYIARTLPENQATVKAMKTIILGQDHSTPPKAMAGYNSTAPLGAWPPPGAGLAGPVAGEAVYLPFIVAACDARGMGPKTADLQQSDALTQAGVTGQSSGQYDAPAWEIIANQGRNQTANENASDAAILAVACILVETGGTWKNFANPTVPDSITFPNDGYPPNPNLDSVGLFQQRNGWGVVAQRMNPYAAAGMFFDKLNDFGWRNMNEGAAIFKVQVGATPALYAAQIPAAKAIVRTFREAQAKSASTVANAATSAVPLVSSVAGSVTNAVTTAVNTAGVASPSSTGAAPVGANLRVGKPVPDSEGAINAAMSMIATTPFKSGGKTPGVGLDGPGLVEWAFRCIGKDVGITASEQLSNPRVVPSTQARRGDIIQLASHEHTGIYLGANMWIQNGGPLRGSVQVLPEPLESVKAVMRIVDNGGPDPTAPFTAPIMGLPRGTPAGTGDSGSKGAQSNVTEPIARNLFAYQFEPWTYAASIASFFTGEKAFIDCQPLIQIVQAVARAGMRNFASAPNGDFIAYTPDEFGMFGKPAILSLEDVEIKDCQIDLSDDPLATHVYVEGNQTMMGQTDSELGWLMSSGVATVENSALFSQLRKTAPGDMEGLSGDDIMRKFGVRPLKQNYQLAGNPAMEFLLAVQVFMGKWSAMYQTSISFTFMPELFPGMRVLLNGHNLQLYCSEVVHTFDYENGFATQARLSSAAAADGAKAATGSTNPLSSWQWPIDNFLDNLDIMPQGGTVNGAGGTSTVTVPGG
jgi:cell wall-associated NlpC family hydrolase